MSDTNIKSAETVTVALNDVNDRIYVLKDGRRITLKCGASHLRGQKSAALPKGAYGLTRIAKADWEEIEKHYGQTKVFKNNLIFASVTDGAAGAEANEKKELVHGLESVDTEKTATKPDKEAAKAKKGKAEA